MGGGAFESGQAYVALSRCRTLDGIVLRQPLRNPDLTRPVGALAGESELASILPALRWYNRMLEDRVRLKEAA